MIKYVLVGEFLLVLPMHLIRGFLNKRLERSRVGRVVREGHMLPHYKSVNNLACAAHACAREFACCLPRIAFYEI